MEDECKVNARQPCLYISHGAGPMPLLGEPSQAPLTKFLKGAAAKHVPSRPSAILVVTAHWEERSVTISTNAKPSMYYDYYNFPAESYEFKYPAEGPSAQLISRVKQLLSKEGITLNEDSKRGFDHGTFVPLLLMYPAADIPVLQMSLMSSLSPNAHYKLGVALRPLRDEGVLIIGSGSSYHNMGGFGSKSKPTFNAAKSFDDWLVETCTKHTGSERQARLEEWEQAPGARESHPKEEHLIPLMVTAGAAGSDAGKAVHQFNMMEMPLSSFLFA